MTGSQRQGVASLARPVVEAAIAVTLLGLVRALLAVVPGTTASLPGTDLAVIAVLDALFGIALVAILANVGRELEPRIEAILDDAGPFAADVANGVKYVVFLFGVVIAYYALGPLAAPLLTPEPGTWPYEAAFFGLGVLALLVVVYRFGRHVGTMTDAVVARLEGGSTGGDLTPGGGAAPAGSDSAGSGPGQQPSAGSAGAAESGQQCPNCGAVEAESANYCGSCGTELHAG